MFSVHIKIYKNVSYYPVYSSYSIKSMIMIVIIMMIIIIYHKYYYLAATYYYK